MSSIDVIVKCYASPEMVEIFSQERRALLWRDLWIALAEAENELGLPVTEVQIEELKKNPNKKTYASFRELLEDITNE